MLFRRVVNGRRVIVGGQYAVVAKGPLGNFVASMPGFMAPFNEAYVIEVDSSGTSVKNETHIQRPGAKSASASRVLFRGSYADAVKCACRLAGLPENETVYGDESEVK